MIYIKSFFKKNKKRKVLLAIVALLFVLVSVFLNIKRIDVTALDRNIQQSIINVEKNENQREYLGYVEILGLMKKQPIIYGTSKADLYKGVGYMKQSVIPGKIGQTVLSMHREYKEGFNKLQYAKKDYVVKIHWNQNNKDYYYRLTTSLIINNDEPGWAKAWDTKERLKTNQLVLSTCYPFNENKMNPPKRFIYYGELIDEKQYDRYNINSH